MFAMDHRICFTKNMLAVGFTYLHIFIYIKIYKVVENETKRCIIPL